MIPRPNCYRFLVIVIFIATNSPKSTYAQQVYEGQVIDKTTEVALSNVNVKLAKQRLRTQTNEQGYFKLTVANSSSNDTLDFSLVGYKTYRLAASDYQKQMFILLQTSDTQLNEVVISGKKTKPTILEEFAYSDLKRTDIKLYKQDETLFYTIAAYAKRFQAPKANASLINVQFGRRDQEEPRRATTNKSTRFNICVFSVNEISGAPEHVLFKKEISLSDNSLKINVDLRKENIVLPSESFFIAIEWLRIPYNEIIQNWAYGTATSVRMKLEDVAAVGGSYRVIYQPLLIGYKQAKKAQSWIKTGDAWTLYEHPDFEIALSAGIIY